MSASYGNGNGGREEGPDLSAMHSVVFHIVGGKNRGKTTLVKRLVEGFVARGFEVGTLKHSSHTHPLDREGSDSDTFRGSGADPSLFVTPDGVAAVLGRRFFGEAKRMAVLRMLYSECDLVLVESFRRAKGPKILVRPESPGEAAELDSLMAVISDEGGEYGAPVFRSDDEGLFDFLMDRAGLAPRNI